jgi:uncharacterized protein (TIGR03083 family)
VPAQPYASPRMELATLYAETRGRLLDLATSTDDERACTPVPALPGWTVKDAYAHLTGLCADVLDDRLDGAGTPEWTARQVAERTALKLSDVCAEWAARGPNLDDRLRAAHEAMMFVCYDVWTHEQDVRGALGTRGVRDDERTAFLAGSAVGTFDDRLRDAGAPAVRIVHSTGERVLGDGAPIATLSTDDYELLRILFARRSVTQVRSAGWDGDPTPALSHLHLFALPAVDLVD